MTEIKRAWKIHEFVAHASNVNCVSIGRKSGRVIATGGEDRKVNLWNIDKPNCIMTLQGHTTPVECVRFGSTEEMVVAGSMSGALKVWDVVEAKILRTFTGHKAAIRGLDFHPYGPYTVSASQDSNIKLWDIKRKGCIFTYKGHTNGVNCVRFSPDGQWLASVGDDSYIKIWDLSAGKLLADLKGHTGPVNTLDFHPNEMLLASGSSDRTVKFWDLGTFDEVDSTEESATPIRCISFHPDGACLYSGSGNQARVYGWEPYMLYDTIPMGWGEVADMAFNRQQLIGASFSQTNVSTFAINTENVQPVCGSNEATPTEPRPKSSARASPRKSFSTDRPFTCASKFSQPRSDSNELPSSPSPDDPANPAADIKNYDEYNLAFKSRSKICHSPPSDRKSTGSNDSKSTPARRITPSDDKSVISKQRPVSTPTEENKPYPGSSSVTSQVAKRTEINRPASPLSTSENKRPDSAGNRRSEITSKRPSTKRTTETATRKTSTTSQSKERSTSPKREIKDARESNQDSRDITRVNDTKETKLNREKLDILPFGKDKEIRDINLKEERESPVVRKDVQFPENRIGGKNIPEYQSPSLDLDDFAPKGRQSMQEGDILTALMNVHYPVITALSGRSRNLQIVRAMWTSGNTKVYYN